MLGDLDPGQLRLTLERQHTGQFENHDRFPMAGQVSLLRRAFAGLLDQLF